MVKLMEAFQRTKPFPYPLLRQTLGDIFYETVTLTIQNTKNLIILSLFTKRSA